MISLVGSRSLPGRFWPTRLCHGFCKGEGNPFIQSGTVGLDRERISPFANVQSPNEQPEGIRVILGQKKGDPSFSSRPNPSEPKDRPEGSLDLLVVDWTFGTEELSAYSGPIQQVERNPCLLMRPLRDASQAGVSGEDRCILQFGWESVGSGTARCQQYGPRVQLSCPGTGNFRGKS